MCINNIKAGVFLVTLICVVLRSQAGSSCAWTGVWSPAPPSGTDDTILIVSGGNLTWSNDLPATVASWTQAETYTGTVTIHTVYGAVGFTNFGIAGDCVISNGVWAHPANPVGNTARSLLRVSVGGNFTVAAAAKINADGAGFRGGYGPGKPAYSTSGAGHGGYGCEDPGSANDYGPAGAIYGSVTEPDTLGSGGGRSDMFAYGGGAVVLAVTGDAIVDGAITANGVNDRSQSGAGGTVNLTARSLAGGGTLSANAGPPGTASAGSAGGRVSVKLTGAVEDFGAFDGAMTAYGCNRIGFGGAAGTVYKQTGAQAAGHGALVIDNNNAVNYLRGVCTAVPPGVDLNDFSGVVITNKGNLGVFASNTLDFGTANLVFAGMTNSYVTLQSAIGVTFPDPFVISNFTLVANTPISVTGSMMIASSGNLTHGENKNVESVLLELTVSSNLTVSGSINVDARGYRGAYGPGTPATSVNGSNTCSHGGMGGVGYLGSVLAGVGATYGSILNPVNIGSGGNFNSSGGPGAGAVNLMVGGNLILNGSISASALSLVGSGASGSGGSVNITAGTLSGGGAITAKGILYNSTSGGGRIAVKLTQALDFSSYSGLMAAYGGNKAASPAAAGTIYRATVTNQAGTGTVLVDNGGIVTNQVFTPLPAFSSSMEDIAKTVWVVSNNAILGLVKNASVESLTLTTNAWLDLGGFTLTVKSLTVAGADYDNGTYTPSQISSLIDRVGGGTLVVYAAPVGTLITVR